MTASFVGKVIDNYRILESIGVGGMGIVFKAIHIKLDKLFALKMIAPGMVMNKNFIKRFQTEAKALAKFEDPNIVRIYDLRSFKDQWFIVMEYVEGINLLDKIKKDGPFHWQEALQILKQMLSAIGHAHDSGIIHRDIKPNNVMITKDGMVKVTDFGLAKDQTSFTNTMTIASGGTLYYMSPEHVKGFSFTDKRSDIYSIGMTLFEMITGNVPFQNINSDFDIRESIIRKEFERPTTFNPDIPIQLEEIIIKSIAKNPEERYQTTNEMKQAVMDFETTYKKRSTETVLQKNSEKGKAFNQDKILEKIDHFIKGFRFPKTDLFKRNQFFKIGIGVEAILILILVLVLFNLEYLSPTIVQDENKENINISSLSVLSQPPTAAVFLNGDSIGQTPLMYYLLEPDQYSLNLVKKHHKSIDTTILLQDSSDLKLVFALQTSKKIEAPVKRVKRRKVRSTPIYASLFINSDPSNAEIWLNGKFKGNTPMQLSTIKPGNYQIMMKKNGYQSYQNQVKLNRGKNQPISLTLVPLTGGLSVIKEPPSALVLLDGKEINNQEGARVDLKHIPIGEHRVDIVQQGYARFTKDIHINPNENETIHTKLTRLQGDLSIQVRPWGSIYINDQLKEASADIKYKIRLPVDQYEIKIVHPTLGKWKKMIQVHENKQVNLTVDFNKKIKMAVNAFDEEGNPILANIYLDDQYTGKSTPEKISLRIGVHRLFVKKDGYIAVNGEKEIIVYADFKEPQTFILKKIE